MQTMIDRHLPKREKKQSPAEKQVNRRSWLKSRLAYYKAKIATEKNPEERALLLFAHARICSKLRKVRKPTAS